jgi:hypothetical protein
MSKAGHQKPSDEKGMQDIEKKASFNLVLLCLRTMKPFKC